MDFSSVLILPVQMVREHFLLIPVQELLSGKRIEEGGRSVLFSAIRNICTSE